MNNKSRNFGEQRWKKTRRPKGINPETALVICLNFVFITRKVYLRLICFSLSLINPFISGNDSGHLQGICPDSELSVWKSRLVCALREDRQWKEATFHIRGLKVSHLSRDTSNYLGWWMFLKQRYSDSEMREAQLSKDNKHSIQMMKLMVRKHSLETTT